ncbi:MAG: hypothetical protein HC866_13920 [Leptolyngbyaceae cyanobacterium RU_5_1]|nr:hypothetical protein [Leptolyngbyaceae cyanobacterium RU_5_1]
MTPRRSRSNLPLIVALGFLLCLGVGGLVAYLLVPDIVPRLLSLIDRNSGAVAPTSPPETPTSPPIDVLPSPSLTPKAPGLTVRSRVQINRSASHTHAHTPVVLQSRPGTSIPSGASPPTAQSVPIGSVLEVISQQVLAGQTWLHLRVCSLPDAVNSPAPRQKKSLDAPTGQTRRGWLGAQKRDRSPDYSQSQPHRSSAWSVCDRSSLTTHPNRD